MEEIEIQMVRTAHMSDEVAKKMFEEHFSKELLELLHDNCTYVADVKRDKSLIQFHVVKEDGKCKFTVQERLYKFHINSNCIEYDI